MTFAHNLAIAVRARELTRLGRLIVVLLIVFIAAVAIIRLGIGRTHTLYPLLAAMFSNPDGSTCVGPCLFGLRPSHATYEQELAILHQFPIVKNMVRSERSLPDERIYANMAFTISVDPKEVWLGIHANLGPNAAPKIPFADGTPLTLGETITEFGSPDYVIADRLMVGVYFIKQHLYFVAFNGVESRFGPDSVVVRVGRVVDNDPSQLTSNMLPWKGFDVDGTR